MVVCLIIDVLLTDIAIEPHLFNPKFGCKVENFFCLVFSLKQVGLNFVLSIKNESLYLTKNMVSRFRLGLPFSLTWKKNIVISTK